MLIDAGQRTQVPSVVGGHTVVNRPFVLDGVAIVPGPSDGAVRLSRRSGNTNRGVPIAVYAQPPLLTLAWETIVADWTGTWSDTQVGDAMGVATLMGGIERALLAHANLAETLCFDWPERRHSLALDFQELSGYLIGYEVTQTAGLEAKVIWACRLDFAVTSDIEADPPDLVPGTNTDGSHLRTFAMVAQDGSRLPAPSSVKWGGPQRDASLTPSGATLVTTGFRECGLLTFGWSGVPDVDLSLTNSFYSADDKTKIQLTKYLEYLDYGDWVQIQGLNPATAEAGHVANGRVVSITATPLAGLPARYDAEITVALAAAR